MDVLHKVVLENARDLARRGLISPCDLRLIERKALTRRPAGRSGAREGNMQASQAA